MPQSTPSEDDYPIRLLPGALPEFATVPLVVYVGEKRYVIGEATVRGNEIMTVLGDQIADEVMDKIISFPSSARFSLGFDPAVRLDPSWDQPELLPKPIYKKKDNHAS